MNSHPPAGFARSRSLHAFVVLLGLAVVWAEACAEKTPSQPSRTTTGLTIAGPNALLVSQTANYIATATYSDGASSAESATWTSSSNAVAEISTTGQLTALTSGSTTVAASVAGLTATFGVEVTNPIVGQWVLTASANPGNPSGINTRIKTFTENEWSIQQTTSGGAVVFRHGGRYTLRGTAYTETVDFANANTANLIGQTFTATLTLGADQFTQSAPIAETWTRVP